MCTGFLSILSFVGVNENTMCRPTRDLKTCVHVKIITIIKVVPIYAMHGAWGERRYSLTSTLEGGEWSASRHGRALPPGERAPGTHCTGGWVDPRAGLDAEGRGKILCLCRGQSLVVQSVVRHYTKVPGLLILFNCATSFRNVCTKFASDSGQYPT
jgi:hypothetical protein